MTKIKHDQKIMIDALLAAGTTITDISHQINISRTTISSYVSRKRFLENMPKKVILKKTVICGRKPLMIKNFLKMYPKSTLDEIICFCSLNCSKSTLSRFLKKSSIFYEKASQSLFINKESF